MKQTKRVLSIVSFILLLMPGITHAEEKTFVKPPDFVAATNSKGTIKYIDAPSVGKIFRSYSPILKGIIYNHHVDKFIIPDKTWLNTIIRLNRNFLLRTQIQPQDDAWDCENYSTLLTSYASIRLWKAGHTDTRLALGWMRVLAKYKWAGIPDAIHALVFAVTEDGILVIEPQNGQQIMLKDYPNKAYIEEVYLF